MKHLPLALAALILASTATAQAPHHRAAPEGMALQPVASDLAAEFGAQLNAYRKSKGRSPLTVAPGLERAAADHADDMAKKGYFSHKGRDGSTPEVRINRRGCSGRTAENIAGGYPSVSAVMKGWRKSKLHNENLLQSEVRYFGIAKVGDKWVLNLASNC
ncbi:CAP domain-containing protein [Vannielia litorea]|uniref:CAP domain-containing protein n=1 Tax=Vannielia litorea TaxID=1217970 RepID=UPI001BCEC311|nr:CAP domain-containing protein [Vannielia litorea]MBS8228247.1 CAP domain-containing protein [Vannielia litorea]